MASKKKDKRSALLRAALELFAENGFNGSSTALIAKRAGVASGTLFFYFKSKEELIHELSREVLAKVENQILEPFPADMAVRERLLRTLSNLLRYCLDNPAEFKFIEQYRFSPLSEKEMRSNEEKYEIQKLLLHARDLQIIKDAPMLVLEAIVFGPITSLAKEHANLGTPIDEEVCRLVIEACWDGVKR
jgi:TetR/AcrR family transcriptional regulator, repressor of fatR-cypB operon